jgi:hypothetical protein
LIWAEQRIAELEQQLAHEKWLREQSEFFCVAVQDQRDDYRQRLAECQAQEKVLRESLQIVKHLLETNNR